MAISINCSLIHKQWQLKNSHNFYWRKKSIILQLLSQKPKNTFFRPSFLHSNICFNLFYSSCSTWSFPIADDATCLSLVSRVGDISMTLSIIVILDMNSFFIFSIILLRFNLPLQKRNSHFFHDYYDKFSTKFCVTK